jgi:membrane-associated phospholipid phosphatase
MRIVELVILIYCGYLTIVLIARPLPPARRSRAVWLLGLMTAAVIGAAFSAEGVGHVVRDWLPAVCILLGYWASGALFVAPMAHWERRLAAIDRRLLASVAAVDPIRGVLELAYLSVYLVIPAGFAVVYLSHAIIDVDRYWTIVVLAEFGCYAMLPWIQTRPPRSIAAEPPSQPPSWLRRMNLSVLEHGSIQANTFPSAHTAGAIATALAVMSPRPAVGVAFLVWAFLIAVGSVVGRYHYAADAILGAIWALVVWALVSV